MDKFTCPVGGSGRHEIVGREEGKCWGGECTRCGLKAADLDACWCTYNCNSPEDWARILDKITRIKEIEEE